MKLKTVQYFETSAGMPVKTIGEWKQAEVLNLFGASLATGISASEIIDKTDRLIEILSQKDKGRPVGEKDRVPRKKKDAPVV